MEQLPCGDGESASPGWLAVDETLHLFHTKRGPARRAFARFVAYGINAEDPFDQMPRPGFLGSESFLVTVLDKFDNTSVSTEVPKKLRPARSLEQIARAAADRDQAITEAYRTGAYTLTEIARHFGIHQSTASRIARREDPDPKTLANISLATLNALIERRELISKIELRAEPVREGSSTFDLSMINHGQHDAAWPAEIGLPANCASGESANGFQMQRRPARLVHSRPGLLKAGEVLSAGWVRCIDSASDVFEFMTLAGPVVR